MTKVATYIYDTNPMIKHIQDYDKLMNCITVIMEHPNYSYEPKYEYFTPNNVAESICVTINSVKEKIKKYKN